jgi:arylsulfatase A-like enzyme
MRTRLIILAAVIVVAAGVFLWLGPRGSSQPNVLLICVDTLRHDHVGFAGYERPVSPNIDALAGRGLVFPVAYSQSGWTMPSMATMFTGRYPTDTGATDFHRSMDRSLPTLASILRGAGYDTRAFVSHMLLTPTYGFNKGFRKFDFSVLQVGHPHDVSTGGRLTDLAISDLDALEPPFFMWVHYFDPHFEYLSHDEWKSFGDSDIDRYDQEIAYTDREIGRLLSALDDRGLLDNTIVIFTSDHGEEFGDHGGAYHYTSYEEVMRVPLSITGPGIAPGVSDVRAQQIDFLPTVLSALGIAEVPEGLPGVDLLNPPAGKRPVFMERDRPPGHRQRTIVDGDIKLIAIAPADTNLIPWASRGTFSPVQNVHDGTFMYDLSYDPDETDNIYIEGAPHTERLLAKLNAFMEGRGASSDEVQMDEATREKLEALGYVQ